MTTVMVVEDDPVFLTRFCGIVASAPELTLLAAVGDLASARRQLARQAPDVLLTDLGLPDGSGIEVGRALSARLPVIALSGYGREQDRDRSTEAGFAAHLVKPADPAQVHACLSGLLARQEPGATA